MIFSGDYQYQFSFSLVSFILFELLLNNSYNAEIQVFICFIVLIIVICKIGKCFESQCSKFCYHFQPNWSFLILITFFFFLYFFPFFFFFFNFFEKMAYLIHNLKYLILFQHIIQYLRKCILFLCRLWSYPYLCQIIFPHILALHNHTQIHICLLYRFLILIDLNWFPNS